MTLPKVECQILSVVIFQRDTLRQKLEQVIFLVEFELDGQIVLY